VTKKHIGQIVSFKFNYINDEEVFRGYIIDYNEDWTLLKYNVNDFLRDGYIILRNKFISEYKRETDEKFYQQVLDLKGQSVTPNDKIPINDIKTILNYLTDKFGVFQFDLRSNDYCYIGRVKLIKGNTLIIDYLDTKGKWSEIREYKLGNIRTIEFDTDYINSLLLVANSKIK